MTRHLILFITFCLLQLTVVAQTDSVVTLANKYRIDDNITYKGGEDRIRKILRKNLNYPQKAVKDSISGTVYLYFTIDTNGHSTDIQIMKGVREDLNNEAIRCVDLLDEWIIGRHNGKKIKLHHILPVKFSLTDK